jgi:hypothetical protein
MKVTADIEINCSLETLLNFTQLPTQHQRWDLRFSEIEYLPKAPSDKIQRFRYVTKLGLGLSVAGWGETVLRPNCLTSALRFGSDDFKSLIRQGAGCWIYKPNLHGIHFSTIYDYQVRYGWWGRSFDRLIFRPGISWATRWSFDRLRLWIERGLNPKTTLRLWLLKMLLCLIALFLCLYSILLQIQHLGSSIELLGAGSGLVWCLASAAALDSITPKASRAKSSPRRTIKNIKAKTESQESYENLITF